jgi:hypothetical protein
MRIRCLPVMTSEFPGRRLTMRSQNVTENRPEMCSFLQKPPYIDEILFRQKDVLSWKMIARYHSKVQWTLRRGSGQALGTRRVILTILWLWAFLRFDSESTLAPTATNASRWAGLLN